MSGITIPTLDEIAGHTVMVKLRNLIKRFITFAEEVDEKIDEPLEQATEAVETANTASANANSAVNTANAASANANNAVTTANAASQTATNAASTVAGYNTRLTIAEGEIDTLQSDLDTLEQAAVLTTGNQNIGGVKTFATLFRGLRGAYIRTSLNNYHEFARFNGNINGNALIIFICAARNSFGMFSINCSFNSETKTPNITSSITNLMSVTGSFKIALDYDSNTDEYVLLFTPNTNNVNIYIDIMYNSIGAGYPFIITYKNMDIFSTTTKLSEMTI